MDCSKGFKYRGTFASEASGPQKLEKLHLGGNLKFFGYWGSIGVPAATSPVRDPPPIRPARPRLPLPVDVVGASLRSVISLR